MRSVERDVRLWLAEYGAEDITVVPGGKHHHIHFTFRGKPFVHNLQMNPDPNRGHLNLFADLRRKLGKPVIRRKRKTRKLEDMIPMAVLPAAEAAPAAGGGNVITTKSRLALYDQPSNPQNIRWELLVPNALMKRWGTASYVFIERLKGDTVAWQIRKSHMGAAMATKAGNKKSYSDETVFTVSRPDLTAGLTPCGLSPCAVSIIDDAILVEFNPETAVAKQVRKTRTIADIIVRKPLPQRTFAPEPPAPPPPTEAPRAAVPEIIPQDQLTLRARQILLDIVDLETRTGYKLMRDGAGKPFWQAPRITL